MTGYTAVGHAVAICDSCDRIRIAAADFDPADFTDLLEFEGWLLAGGQLLCPPCTVDVPEQVAAVAA